MSLTKTGILWASFSANFGSNYDCCIFFTEFNALTVLKTQIKTESVMQNIKKIKNFLRTPKCPKIFVAVFGVFFKHFILLSNIHNTNKLKHIQKAFFKLPFLKHNTCKHVGIIQLIRITFQTHVASGITPFGTASNK